MAGGPSGRWWNPCGKCRFFFLDFGASHVIVTSYVLWAEIRFDRLQQLVKAVGKEHVVLDLSCRKKGDSYYIVTDRWQKFTNQCLDEALMEKLHSYCDEFLVHAVNVEGTGTGVDEDLLKILAKEREIPITYAGGIGSYEDIEKFKKQEKQSQVYDWKCPRFVWWFAQIRHNCYKI